MYMAVRNIMPTDKMKVPFTAAPSHRLHFDPKLMLHRPGCLVVVKYPKDHPHRYVQRRAGRVQAFSLDATQPHLWLKSRSPALAKSRTTRKKERECCLLVLNLVEIFDHKLPFVDPSCMPDRQGFSDKDIESLHRPNNARPPELAHARQHRQPRRRWCMQPMMLLQYPPSTRRYPPLAMRLKTPFWRRQTRHWRQSARNDSCCSTWEKTHFSSTHGK